MRPVCSRYIWLTPVASNRYATHPELNSWTPLIHDEFASLSSTSSPSAALTTSASPVHLTLDVKTLQTKAYSSSKLGLSVDASSNRTFVPLKTELKVEHSEHSGRECNESGRRDNRRRGALR